MAPEYGATMGFFPVDDATIDYLTATGRTPAEIDAFASYFKAQGLYGIPRGGRDRLHEGRDARPRVDQGVARRDRSGPQDRIELGSLKRTFTELFSKPVAENGFGQATDKLGRRYSTRPGKRAAQRSATQRRRCPTRLSRATSSRWSTTTRRPIVCASLAPKYVDIGNGDVLIAAITSCTNTSNPGVLLAAGPAREKGRRARASR